MSCSVVKLNRLGLVLRIEIIVFSLNPAFTSWITAAFVSGVSEACCADAYPPGRQETIAMSRKPRMDFAINAFKPDVIIFTPQLLFTRLCFFCFWNPPVAVADLFHVIASLFIRRHFVPKLDHGAFARVVACKYKIYTIVETIQQLP